jgi:antitoxin component of MazEF toxin-antitoxin module
MQVKLRQIGHSIGMTIPAHELKAIGAHLGDTLEVDIMSVVKQPRSDWDNDRLWKAALQAPIHLDDSLAQNDFDKTEWQW